MIIILLLLCVSLFTPRRIAACFYRVLCVGAGEKRVTHRTRVWRHRPDGRPRREVNGFTIIIIIRRFCLPGPPDNIFYYDFKPIEIGPARASPLHATGRRFHSTAAAAATHVSCATPSAYFRLNNRLCRRRRRRRRRAWWCAHNAHEHYVAQYNNNNNNNTCSVLSFAHSNATNITDV